MRIGHSVADKTSRLVIDKLLSECDILCLQETWLAKQNLDKLNSLNVDFHGAGESTTDLSTRIVRGRIAGGVAILWNSKYDPIVKVVRLDVNWAIGLEINFNDKKFIILNVYMPYDSYQLEDEFINNLAFVKSFVEDNGSTSVFVIGDFNADLSDHNSAFANHLMQFCNDNNILMSSKLLLPDNSFTYISDAWHSTSWLDHCISTADAHASLNNMEICYGLATSDHIPISITVNVNDIPMLVEKDLTDHVIKLDWSKVTDDDINKYSTLTEVLLQTIHLPRDALTCINPNCTNTQHCNELNEMYENIIKALIDSSLSLQIRENRMHQNIKPGWNEFVAQQHATAREAFKLWQEAGKPKQGPVFDLKRATNANFKYALRYIKRKETTMRADSLAKKLQCNNHYEFWNEIRVMNNAKTSLPSNINGVSGSNEIAELWRRHYCDLFNSVKNDQIVIDNVDFSDSMVVQSDEVYEAILQLGNNKACGLDRITAEHLKYSSHRLHPLLSLCFTGFLTHGVLPDSIMSVLLVPVIKDKAAKLNDLQNYRPIALASILSKVLERILLTRLEMYVHTHDNQFGFKKKHGTDLCIYALKEIVAKYQSLHSSIFLCFIDASKAFDRVNHKKLFLRLCLRGVSKYLIRILVFWYANQMMQVKWGSVLSAPFHVSNGVKQGGILSPVLFNVYMDDLSKELNKCNTGCLIGASIVNHLMYADDLVIFSPYSAGLQQLLKVCSDYGSDNDIIFNPTKSNVMVVRSREDKSLNFPVFSLCDKPLVQCKQIKYLGHVLTDDWCDDRDMYRQCCKLYAQANMLMRKFSMCSPSVKRSLFRAFCTPLYTAHLWWN